MMYRQDKRAVELSEAINPMFCWYEKSAICYAYLSDVHQGQFSRSAIMEEATGVPHHILTGIASLHTCSVAQRMSWASRRVTTRPEDMALLLGWGFLT
ncbi:hypothetical protein QC762_504480 [Podospora pseudocomata]|uniref:Uncharacterized protein n=1 Tax=Podospora pseudocomata TaxID=2093779 RepID=A0ABR0GBC6_9PEZI|nr:hypothetical protein QC762_504480 [Podospora pseudocomata]